MGVNRLLRTPCTIIRRTHEGEDPEGNPEVSIEEVETVCALQQKRRLEHDESGEVSDTFWILFLPIGTEIGTGDAVVVKGDEYEVTGESWHAEEGSPALWHVECTLERTAGTGE